MAEKPLAVLPVWSALRRRRLVLYAEHMAEEGVAAVSVDGSFRQERNVFYDEIETICVYKRPDWRACFHLIGITLLAVIAAATGNAWWLIGSLALTVYMFVRIFVLQSRVARVATAEGPPIEFRVDRPRVFRNARRFFLTLLALAHRATGTPWEGSEPPDLPPELLATLPEPGGKP